MLCYVIVAAMRTETLKIYISSICYPAGGYWNCPGAISSNGNIFRFTGPLCGDITGHR